MKFGTKVIHAGVEPDPSTGAIMTPIFQTSTYVQTAPGIHKGYEYARTQNPTRHVLETNLATLEDANYACCFSSGMAAIDAVLKLLEPGNKVLASRDLYGGSYRIFEKVFSKYRIDFQFIEMLNIQQYIDKKTKVVWIETPSNPLLEIIDIEGLAAVTKDHGAYLVVDNTLATPYLQKPLNLGADIVVHSITKYIAGHSDVIMGAVLTNNTEIEENIGFIQNSCGAVPSPYDCFLTLRGIKTLHLRMNCHCENGSKVALYLEEHPKIKKVYYPGLVQHFNHDLAKKQMNQKFGGMISITLKSNTLESTHRFLKKLKLFALAESLGGVESLVGLPDAMTHTNIPEADRKLRGLSSSLIRLSVGIEDVEDLIEDLDQAL